MMRLARPLGLITLVVTALLMPGDALAAPNRGNSQFAHETHKKDKNVKKDKSDVITNGPGSSSTTPVSVPEPATIVLLGAAAGLAACRKVRQDRRRMNRI